MTVAKYPTVIFLLYWWETKLASKIREKWLLLPAELENRKLKEKWKKLHI